MLIRNTLARSAGAAGFAALMASFVLPAAAQAPAPERQGRFSMQPVEGGFLRLDTQTGEVSQCTKKPDGFACLPVRDDKSISAEIERLKTENQALKDDIKRLQDLVTSEGKNDDNRVNKLPSEKDVDQALDYVERMYKKFRDRIKQFDSDTDRPKTPL